MHTHIPTHTSIHTYIHTYIHPSIHTYIHTCNPCIGSKLSDHRYNYLIFSVKFRASLYTWAFLLEQDRPMSTVCNELLSGKLSNEGGTLKCSTILNLNLIKI